MRLYSFPVKVIYEFSYLNISGFKRLRLDFFRVHKSALLKEKTLIFFC